VSGNAFITVDVRNSGGSRLTNCEVEIVDGEGRRLSSPTGPTELNPGQAGSYSENGAQDFQIGSIYIAIVTCQGPGAIEVIDKKSAVAHI
jgi:hypothetical protein